jgi:hypothetical protein
MNTSQPLILRWGIISTGNISTAFVKVSRQVLKFFRWLPMPYYYHPLTQDILLDPKT